MADYTVKFSTTARANLVDIFLGNHHRYTLTQRSAYLDDLEAECDTLKLWPKRYVATAIKGREYRKFIFKAHTIYYRV